MWGRCVAEALDLDPASSRGGTFGELCCAWIQETAGGAEHGTLAATGGAKDHRPWGCEVKLHMQMKRTESSIDAQAVMRAGGVG